MRNSPNNPNLCKETNVNVNDPSKTSGTSPPGSHVSPNYSLVMLKILLDLAFIACQGYAFDPAADVYLQIAPMLMALIRTYESLAHLKSMFR